MKGYTKMKLFNKATELLNFMVSSKTALPNTVTNNTYLQCCLETDHY
jgi:pentatricopeptide repeat protein